MITRQYVQDLYDLTLAQLQKKYRQKSKDKPTIKDQRSLNVLRRKYKELYQVEKLPNEQINPKQREQLHELLDQTIDKANVNPADVDGFRLSAGSHEGYIKNSDGEIEYTKELGRKGISLYVRKNKIEPETFSPAVPAKITPSKRKPVKRDYRTYFVFGDAQIDYRRMDDNELMPLHDERAMRIARMICKDLQPEEIVNLGDNVDLSSLSRFKSDSDHFHRTLGPSFQRAHDYYAELRSDNPNAKIVEVSSNHEVRLRDWVLKYMPQIYGAKRPGETEDYPVMTYPYLANLKHVSVDFIGGYGAAEYPIGGNDDLLARHGRETSSNGTTASKIMKNYPETNNVHGHSHEMSMASKTLRNGRILTSIAVGALCRTDGVVPGYHSAVDDHNKPVHRQQNWQQSVLAIYDYGNGHYQYDNIPIIDGRAFYKGKEYSGESD